MPNPSTRFTGRTEVIAKLKSHFFPNPNAAVYKRKFFLLYGMGGIGKTQICLKFLEEMSDRWVTIKHWWPCPNKIELPPASLKFSGLMHPPQVPSYRHLRVFVSFVDWMAHLSLLSGGLALWERTTFWSLIMLMFCHLLHWRCISHLESGETFW